MKRFFLLFTLLIVGILALVAQDVDPDPAKFDAWKIISAILAIFSTLFGTIVVKGKKKFGQVVKLGQETVECLDAYQKSGDTMSRALADNVVTEDEKKAMKDSWANAQAERADVKAQWKIVWARKTG